ncbi:hypothetical protein SanaruYs_10410 [Chryseotalea sanaruensis]|uniref:Uncharacterized protein n=1 Tax=Chryseotalea sanaruensis TaxID=2482724 RepID=A0A401U7F6_9BACT|nr:hypothetical protein [Chryseotalea sanaruensis]GCC50823.1 hypothetical protein SanaruYs_10410 [Chryseotalea sanaruensis]
MKVKIKTLATLVITAITIVVLNSCNQDSDIFQPNYINPLISEARSFFESELEQQQENNKHQARGFRKKIIKNPQWHKANVRQLSFGEAVIVPVKFEKELYIPKGKTSIALSDLTYLIFNKNEGGKIKVDIVTSIPDSTYLNAIGDVAFSGVVLVEDWNGDFVKGFIHKNGEVRQMIKNGEGELNARTETLPYCETIEYYSCTAVDTPYGSYVNCVLEYSETTCYSGGGTSDDWSDYPPEGGGSGSGNSGYPSIDDILAINEWEEQINDAQLKPCMQIIISDLKNISQGSVGQIIQKFSGNIPGYNWEVKNGTLPGAENANTLIQFNTLTGTVTTIFDSNKFSNASNLSIARTLLHESIHAYVVAVTFNTLTDPTKRAQLLGPDWLTVAINYGHDFITNNYLIPIADALELYGKSKGYNFSRQFYDDLAWGGLTHYQTPPNNETSLFLQKIPNVTDRNRILNTIVVELSGKDFYGNSVAKKGNNAGC